MHSNRRISKPQTSNVVPFILQSLSRPNADQANVLIFPPSAALRLTSTPPIVTIRTKLKVAVAAAIAAYEKSGRMRDAAMTYAAHGFPVFPVGVQSKKPVPRKDPDPTGKFPKGIPGTGGLYKASTDPVQIHAWWGHNEYAIGMPTGPATGVWCLDVDTGEDHADGVAAWNRIAAEHDPIVTREHRSATGGPHLIFAEHPDYPLGCSSGGLPDGISVKGRGGYILVPPSKRKGRSYSVYADIDATIAPQWLYDLILQGRSPRDPSSPSTVWDNTTRPWDNREPVDLEKLADAMPFVPNDDMSWEEWTAHGLALFAGCGEKGFEFFDGLSQKSEKYDEASTRQRWREIVGCPPDHTGLEKLYSIAREHGWIEKLRIVSKQDAKRQRIEPTYPEKKFRDAEAARPELRQRVRDFLEYQVKMPGFEDCSFVASGESIAYNAEFPHPAHLLKAEFGLGKTLYMIEEITAWLRRVGSVGPVLFAVSTRNLIAEVAERFQKLGVDARTFYGRDAPDPDNPKIKMCVNEDVVELALQSRSSIAETCCKKGKTDRCEFYDVCGYQKQIPPKGEQPQVWVFASSMLFHAQEAFVGAVCLFIDEEFCDKGLRGVNNYKELKASAVYVKELLSPKVDHSADADMLGYFRKRLGTMLDDVDIDHGNVTLDMLEDEFTVGNLRGILAREWAAFGELEKRNPLHPGMTKAELKRVKTSTILELMGDARRIIDIWQEVRNILADGTIKVSGRLLIRTIDRHRCLCWCGPLPLTAQFVKLPIMHCNATMPDQKIIRVFLAGAEPVADLSVATPSAVRVQQILRAPTSSQKLDKNEKHRESVRCYILARWLELGRCSTLVVCQYAYELWLKKRGLPAGIEIAHYNNIAGLDCYKNVRLLVLAGRTQPGPDAPEAIVGALFGEQPVPLPLPKGKRFNWYPPIVRRIRLADGGSVAVKNDVHPDPIVEAARRQITEAELEQAFGRGRAINRTDATPLDVDLLVDTCLPLTVNKVTNWKPPSLFIQTAVDDGVVLTSPADMVKAWPAIWKNEKAADRSLKKDGVPSLPGFTEVRYRHAGERQKPRLAYINLTQVPDPVAWLARLGSIKCL